MMPFFSIIIPTYNSELTLHKTVKSVLEQGFKNFEILVIDGISKDNTLGVLQNFTDDRIKITSQKDSGVYDAMNKGIEYSNGKYLYFLGSDDCLYNADVLQMVYNTLETEPADIIYGNALLISNNTLDAGRKMDLERLLFYQNINHQAIFYAKECFVRLGKFNLKYPILADWDFNIRCFMHPEFKITYLETIIAFYNDISGLSNDAAKRDEEFLRILPAITRRKLTTELSSIKYSREYHIGRIIYNPIKKVLKIFSKNSPD